jgi:hypothetical protein
MPSLLNLSFATTLKLAKFLFFSLKVFPNSFCSVLFCFLPPAPPFIGKTRFESPSKNTVNLEKLTLEDWGGPGLEIG